MRGCDDFTMRPLAVYLRAYSRRRHVRPWALLAPILVLLICLPLLHPLRNPATWAMSDQQMSRWGTVEALVEQQTFDIDQTQFIGTIDKIRVGETWYSNQPPVGGLLLAGPYWLLHALGYSFKNNPALVEYLLTLLAVTLPVAAAAGMLYRMGRLFAISRPWRAGLALVVVLGSGLISYATVLNPYAPGAALLLLAMAILVKVGVLNAPLRSGPYIISAGFFAALAAAVDPAAIVFMLLLGIVVLAMPWRVSSRIAGLLMFGIGMLPPILLHVAISEPITGDWRLGLEPLPARQPLHWHRVAGLSVYTPATATALDDSFPANAPTIPREIYAFLQRSVSAVVGTHGILSHFPIMIFGLAGLGIVLRKHWPGSTKALALVTLVGSVVVVVHYILLSVDWKWAMFAVRWYVLVLPICLFWIGAWARRSHGPVVWAIASLALTFSIVVALIGATDPMPPAGYDHYTAVEAWHHLQSSSPLLDLTPLASR